MWANSAEKGVMKWWEEPSAKHLPTTSWLGIPIFGSDFWDPHWNWNSNSIFDSKDSGWIFFLNSTVEKLRNWSFDSKIWNSKKIALGTQYTSFCIRHQS
jgi:hypothetical protein